MPLPPTVPRRCRWAPLPPGQMFRPILCIEPPFRRMGPYGVGEETYTAISVSGTPHIAPLRCRWAPLQPGQESVREIIDPTLSKPMERSGHGDITILVDWVSAMLLLVVPPYSWVRLLCGR